jgi:hypothetical protein
MKAVVFDCNASRQGVYTCNRSESRWVANVAMLFRECGMDVSIHSFSHPSITYTPEYQKIHDDLGIQLTYEDSPKADISFTFRHLYRENKKQYYQWNKNVDYILQGCFWGTKHNLPRGVSVTPFSSPTPGVPVLPFNYIDELKPPQFHKKTIIWTTRGPFATSQGDANFKVNLYHLETTAQLAKQGYRVIFTCKQNLILDYNAVHPASMQLQNLSLLDKAKELVAELETLPNVEFHNYLPMDRFLELFQQASIVVNCNGAGALPYCSLYGVVPVLLAKWDSLFISDETLVKEFGIKLPYGKTNSSMVNQQMYKLLTDETYYNNRLAKLRQYAPTWTTERAVQQVRSILNNRPPQEELNERRDEDQEELEELLDDWK